MFVNLFFATIVLLQSTIFLPIVAGMGQIGEPISDPGPTVEIGEPISVEEPTPGQVPAPGQYERHPEIGWPMLEDCREVEDEFPNRVFWDSDDEKVIVCNYDSQEFPFNTIRQEFWHYEDWAIYEDGSYNVEFTTIEGTITVGRCEWNALGCDAP